MSQLDDFDRPGDIALLVDFMLELAEAGAINYCCSPVGDEACALVLGHDGECNSDPENTEESNE
jgi:hypothetical protein